MSKKIPLLILSCLAFSCGSGDIKFDKEVWSHHSFDEMLRPSKRNAMLNDLLTNYKLTGTGYTNIIKLLSEPDWHDSTSMLYDIEEYYGYDIDPIETKKLILFFSRDSTITSHKIETWSATEE